MPKNRDIQTDDTMLEIASGVPSYEEKIPWEDKWTDDHSMIGNVYLFLPIGNFLTGCWLIDQFRPIDKGNGRGAKSVLSALLSDTDLDLGYTNMAAGVDQLSIKPLAKDKGARVFVPLTSDFKVMSAGSSYITSNWFHSYIYTSETDLLNTLFNTVEKIFGKQFWDIDRPISIEVPVNLKYLDSPELDKTNIDENLDAVDRHSKAIKELRLTARAVGGNQSKRKLRTLQDVIKAGEKIEDYKLDVLRAREFSLHVGIDFEKGLCQYLTQSDDINKVRLHQYFSAAVRQSSLNGEDYVPDMLNPLQNIVDYIGNRKPLVDRLSAENLCFDQNGAPLYIPRVNNVTKYDKDYAGAGHENDEMGWSVNHPTAPYVPIDDHPMTKIANKVIYYDAIHNKINYASDGVMQIKDLNRTVPANDINVYQFLHTPIRSSHTLYQGLKSLSFYMSRLPELLQKVEFRASDFAPFVDQRSGKATAPFNSSFAHNGKIDQTFLDRMRLRLSQGITQYLDSALTALSSLNRYYDQAHNIDPNFQIRDEDAWAYNLTPDEVKLIDLVSEGQIKMLRPLGQYLELLCNEIMSKPDMYMEMRSPASSMQSMGIATLYAKYLPRYDAVEKNARAYQKKLEPVKTSKDWKAPALSLKAPGFEYLPHQGKVQQNLAPDAPLTVLSADPGAGKCAIGSTLVPTKQGLSTLKELWERGTNEVPGGHNDAWRELKIGIYSLEGRKNTDRVYKRRGKTVKLKMSNGWTWEGLPEHKFWALDAETLEFRYISAKEMKVGTWIPRAKSSTYRFPTKEPLLKTRTKLKTSEYHKAYWSFDYKLPRYMTPELAELLGWLVSEGCMAAYSIEQHDGAMLNHINNLAKRVFKAHFEDRVFEDEDKSIDYRRFRSFFEDLMGRIRYSNEMIVPECIRSATKESQRRFLQAYFQGDGTIYKRNLESSNSQRWFLQATTTSYTLARQLVHMLDTFGVKATLNHKWSYVSKQGTKDKRPVVDIDIDCYYHERFQKEIGFLSGQKRENLAISVRHKQMLIEAGRQTTNMLTMGEINRFPAEPVWQMEEAFETALDKLYPRHLVRAANGNEHYQRAYNPWTRALKTKGVNWKGFKAPYGYTTRHTINKWFEIFNAIEQPVKEKLLRSKKLQTAMAKVKALLNDFDGFVYLYEKKQGKIKDVYDLSVPDVHNYVASGVHQHNTSTGITRAMLYLQENPGKRVVVICPPFLISNYVEDNLTVTGGKYNILAITRSTVESHGIENIERLVRNAPRNTIFVTDYFFVKGNSYSIPYGTDYIQVNENAEFLKQFKFDRAIVDECHVLKNEDSDITKANTSLLATIGHKMIMSGTIVDSTSQDLVSQIRVLDPTVLGSMDDFISEYAEYSVNGKIVKWKDGAQEKLRAKLETQIKFVQSSEKEWAALLPKENELFVPVNLAKNQMTVCNAILENVLAEIKSNPQLMAKLKNDDEDDSGLEGMLNPFLARIEKFLTAPMSDPLGEATLTGNDQISPKVTAIAKIVQEHTAKKNKGKILILTNFIPSAKAIYDGLPDNLKHKFILYSAAEKNKHKARFQKDPDIIGMVGVVHSLKEGHNFQNAGAIILAETMWNPGGFKQLKARIFRPDVGNKFGIKEKELYWCVANRCVTGDTLVPTDKGIFRIDELGKLDGKRRQDLNLTVGSRYNPQKTLSWWRQGIADTYKVYTESGNDIQGTANHGVLVLENGQTSWAKLGEVSRGQYLAINSRSVVRTETLKLNLGPIPSEIQYRKNDLFECRAKAIRHVLRQKEFTTHSVQKASGYSYWATTQMFEVWRDKGLIKRVGRRTSESGKNANYVYEKTELFDSNQLQLAKTSPIKIPTRMTPELAYCLGLIVSEGITNGTIVKVSMKNKACIEYLTQAMNNVFGLKAETVKKKDTYGCGAWCFYDKHYYTFCVQSKQLNWILEQLGVATGKMEKGAPPPSYRKVVPWSILQADYKSQMAFIAAYYEGDGTHSWKSAAIIFTSYSEEIGKGIQAILNSHGILCSRDHGYVHVLTNDALTLTNAMRPYLKGRKCIPERNYTRPRLTYGIPSDYWQKLMRERFLGKRALGNGAPHAWRYLNDEGKEIAISGREHHYEILGVPKFLYDVFDNGGYDNFLHALKQISISAWSKLQELLKHRYRFVEVISKRKAGKQMTYDLSMTDGTDGKEPAYIANGLISHNTIDVSKSARLMSKMINKAKFDNAKNPLYNGIPEVDLVRMNLDTIAAQNDFATTLANHINAYRILNEKRQLDNEQFAKSPECFKENFKIPEGPPLKDAAIIAELPYVDNGPIPFMEELGLSTYTDWTSQRGFNVDSWDAKGIYVHTEFGDGRVVKSSRATLRVELLSGQTITTNKTKTFVFDNQKAVGSAGKKHVQVKDRIHKLLGLPVKHITLDMATEGNEKTSEDKVERVRPVKIGTPVVKPSEAEEEAPVKTDGKRKKHVFVGDPLTKNANHEFPLYATVLNNQIALAINASNPEAPEAEVLEKEGFQHEGAYAWSYIANRKQMDALVKAVEDNISKGRIVVPPKMLADLKHAQEVFAKTRANLAVESINNASLGLYKKLRMKTPTDPKTMYIYTAIEDGELYIYINYARARQGLKFLKNVHIPGVKFTHDKKGLFMAYFKNKTAAIEFAKAFSAKYKISDLKSLQASLKAIRISSSSSTASK